MIGIRLHGFNMGGISWPKESGPVVGNIFLFIDKNSSI